MARKIYLRLYEELNDFLPPDKRKHPFPYPVDRNATVGELLRRLAVPETEVELVLVNGVSTDFNHRLEEGDFVSVFPVFESLDVTSVLRVRKKPLRQIRFIAGNGLSRLAGYLKRLGFDTLNCHSWPLEKTVRAAEGERRILLTRDPLLLKSTELSRICLVRASEPGKQLLEVLSRFDLHSPATNPLGDPPALTERQ